MISRELVARIKLHDVPAYRLAWSVGLHPSTLSKLLIGAQRVRPGDPRIVKLGQLVGLPPERCFE